MIGGLKATLLRPRGGNPRLLPAVHRAAGEERCALGRAGDHVDIPEHEPDFRVAGLRQPPSSNFLVRGLAIYRLARATEAFRRYVWLASMPPNSGRNPSPEPPRSKKPTQICD